MPEIIDELLGDAFSEQNSILERIARTYEIINETFPAEEFPGWQIDTVFAPSGGIETRQVYDETGVLRQNLIVDVNGQGPDGLGFEPWSFEIESFDAEGAPEIFFRGNDDFTSTAIFYEDDGIHRIEADDRFIRQFNEDGQLEIEVKTFNNGRSRTTVFDETGTIESRITTDPYFGNAPILNPGDGPPISPPEPEIKGNYNWFTIVEQYHDTGIRSEKTTIFDSFDFRTLLYDETGTRQEKQEIDYDGDKPWLAMRIVYDDEGRVDQKIKYFDEDGVPDNFVYANLYNDLKDAGAIDPYTVEGMVADAPDLFG
ncbi:MAG: hypothetical protein AAGC81_13375 [Pseudomonadota bacterium]